MEMKNATSPAACPIIEALSAEIPRNDLHIEASTPPHPSLLSQNDSSRFLDSNSLKQKKTEISRKVVSTRKYPGKWACMDTT